MYQTRLFNPAESALAAIIADDLTGACDAAVHFAERGLLTRVTWNETHSHEPAEVYAINTDTRCSTPEIAAARVAVAVTATQERKPRLLMKKIDSLLRGNVATEILAMRTLLRLPQTIVAPAFPAAGRPVQAGVVYPEAGIEPVDVISYLTGLQSVVVSREAIDDLPRMLRDTEHAPDTIVVDAATDDDLLRLARHAKHFPRILWVGSSGLAAALAAEFFPTQRQEVMSSRPRQLAPVIICVGSDHPATQRQIDALRCRADIVFSEIDKLDYSTVRDHLARGSQVVVRLSRATIESAPDLQLGAKLALHACAGVIATGGDTAMFLLRSLGAKSIQLRSEVYPGVPWGKIEGGAAHGLPIVTKSGALGRTEALMDCIRFLQSHSALPQEVGEL